MHRFRHLAAAVLGDITWRPPGWVDSLVRQRRRVLVCLILLGVLGSGLYGGWQWYEHLPKPETVTFRVQAPGITPIIDDKLVPEPLRLHFGKSVAPLEQIGKPVASGVRMEPAMPGKWQWESDTVLKFEPAEDWPAGMAYRVTLDRNALAPHILLARYTLPWTTPKFAAHVRTLEFYQDPKDPAIKQVVATVDFTHRVEAESLGALARFTMLGSGQTQPSEVHLDKFQRVAYLRTTPITLPERPDFMKITLPKGIRSPQGPAWTSTEEESKVRVPDIYSFFGIDHTWTTIVLNAAGDPEQFLMVETTAHAKSDEVAQALSVYALPPKPWMAYGSSIWGPRDITADILQRSEKVSLKTVPSADELSRLHTFAFHLPKSGQLYVKIDKEIKVPGGYRLAADYDAVVEMPRPARSLQIEGKGGLLALNGERKISVKSRAIPGVEYQIARVATSQINHLVSQTEGNFQRPEFFCSEFSEENISRIATEHQALAVTDPFQPNYSTFDFGPHLAIPSDGGSERGLFFLEARAWDPKDKKTIDSVASERRFILVTDLGLIVKKNADESREVYVASIQNGGPLAGVKVDLLGKNGVPLATGQTDADGRMSLPAMKGATRDRQPVAIVARLGEDVAFLPYAERDRGVNYSRFDIGGAGSPSPDDLEAFLFTERGVYRPGDTIHLGYMVKSRDWQRRLAGLPIEIEVRDAKDQAFLIKRTTVPEGGFGELDIPTAVTSASGVYDLNLYLVRAGERDILLGHADTWVKEFQPDRLKIATELSPSRPGEGWISPDEVKAKISLQNLYGAPATGRRIKGLIKLSPSGFGFPSYPDYQFYDRLLDQNAEPKFQEVDLGDQKTDEAGAAQFDLHLERFNNATYAMTLYTEGFEADDGRSVTARNQVLVSPLNYVVGYKPDGDLGYISRGLPRAVRFVALNREVKPIAVPELRFRLIQRTYVSVLTKQESGSYAYESVERDKELKNESQALPAEGLSYALDTAQPGDYVLELLDPSGVRVSLVRFSVVGSGSVTRSMEKDAELEVKLPRREYQSGDDVEIAITAPYAGSGLITIERDKVYAQAWFHASSVGSVQHIRVPEGLEGTAYVNITYIRSLDSKEIFASPLSSAVEPITVNREHRRLGVHLEAATEAKPGQPLAIKYQADRPCRIVVYAVDHGILQVSDYQLPDPLKAFFHKLALLEETSQLVDLIMPEFSILRALSASGGDGEDLIKKELNPFQRVTEKPVVFWSGVLEADQTERQVVYDVPDYFNGTLKIMAVAYALDAAGSVERSALIRDRYVITPGVPTVAAPGDTFEVGVTVNNGGAPADVQIQAEPSEHLEILQSPTAPLHLESGREATVTFTVRATDKLGSGRLVFHAAGGGEESSRQATISVRPAVPYLTEVQSVHFTKPSAEVAVTRVLHPEYRKLESSVSALPLGLAHGLDAYLKNYPYGCSEQITSKSFCRLMLAGEADFGLTHAEIAAQLEHTFAVQRQRQNDQGGFGYWRASGEDDLSFISVYVTHFLVEAKAAGFAPPPDMLQAALRNLQRMAEKVSPDTLEDARIQAYAIYVLTREDVVTTNFAVNLRDTLEKKFSPRWKSDLTAVYLAGTLAMLKHEDEGAKLMRGYRIGSLRESDCGDYFTLLGADSQYLAILARHFPALLKKLPLEDFLTALKPIESGSFSTLSAAYAVVALKSYSQLMEQNNPQLAIAEVLEAKKLNPLAAQGDLTKTALFSPAAKALHFTGRPPALGLFGQVVTAGFDQTLPQKPVQAGIEIFREYPATAKVGDPITVKLKVRSLKKEAVTNCAIVDLLPGGFEVVGSSLQPGAGTVPGWDFVEVREDRAVFFGTITNQVQEITYQIKPTNRGTYLVPPPFAESMYERGVHGCGVGQQITVVDAK